ncbi:MAG: hypothetical protein R3Y13_04155 [bacterium]
MQIEIFIIVVLVFTGMTITGQLSIGQLVSDNEAIFRKLKEDDFDFYVYAKYGDKISPNALFNQRVRDGLITTFAIQFILIGNFSSITVILSLIVGYFTYKNGYSNVKGHYKRNLHNIDEMLPHYLKNLEILIQHYTVPVAIGKSIDGAPEIFRDGLNDLIKEINSGNSSIDPYMNFAKKYPVRDSMRMMRLLYRLSLGKQERKQEQLLTFSKTISNLQQKARETLYKNRLEKMEGKTMSMLIGTGLGLMVLLILAVLQMMSG